MSRLDELSLACLKTIAAGDYVLVSPCPTPVIERLLSLGLIHAEPRLRLPLEMATVVYRPTSAGWRLLGRGLTD